MGGAGSSEKLVSTVAVSAAQQPAAGGPPTTATSEAKPPRQADPPPAARNAPPGAPSQPPVQYQDDGDLDGAVTSISLPPPASLPGTWFGDPSWTAQDVASVVDPTPQEPLPAEGAFWTKVESLKQTYAADEKQRDLQLAILSKRFLVQHPDCRNGWIYVNFCCWLRSGVGTSQATLDAFRLIWYVHVRKVWTPDQAANVSKSVADQCCWSIITAVNDATLTAQYDWLPAAEAAASLRSGHATRNACSGAKRSRVGPRHWPRFPTVSRRATMSAGACGRCGMSLT